MPPFVILPCGEFRLCIEAGNSEALSRSSLFGRLPLKVRNMDVVKSAQPPLPLPG